MAAAAETHADDTSFGDPASSTASDVPDVPGSQASFTEKEVLDPGQPATSANCDLHWEYLTYDTILPDFGTYNPDPQAPRPPSLAKLDNPYDWSAKRKNICLILSCVSTFLAAYGAGEYGFTQIILRPAWGLGLAKFELGLTTYGLGFAAAPMFLAPFTEINGRRPVFLLSGLLFFVATIGCAVTESFAGMLVARFFAGVGSSTYSTIIGGIISDVYQAKDRNAPMAIYAGAAIGGTGIAPLISGIVVDRVSWRWVFWSHAIAIAILLCFQAFFFKETRGSVLLSRRATAINRYYDQLDTYAEQQHHHQANRTDPPLRNLRYKVLADEERASIGRMLYLSLTTPFKLLVTEPVVFFFSLWAAFAWGILYMCFNVLPLVFQSRHNFTLTEQAAVFAAICVGAIIATLLSVYHEKLASRRFPKMSSTPEGRLYFTCIEAALLPLGLFWFGWTTYTSVHWIVPSIAVGVATVGVYSVYLAVFNYLADVYHRYASSALACQSFCRNVLGATFPLFTNQMFLRLGYPGAASLLGGVGALLTLVPWVLVWNGPAIRARSKLASEIMGQNR